MSTSETRAEEEILEKTRKLIQQGEKEHEGRVPKYNEAYAIYCASPPKKDVLPRWRSRVRVPYARSIIDTNLFNIVAGIPRCIVKPRHPDDVARAAAMQALMDYFVQEDHLSEAQVSFAQQGLIYGVTVAKNHWVYQKTDKMIRGFNELGEDVSTVQSLVTRDGPCFTPWSIYDAWWDPNARDVDTADYVCLRSWKTKEQLERQRYNPDTGIGYKNLDKLFAVGPGKRRPDTTQEQMLGNEQYKRKDAYSIVEIWRDDLLVVLGENQVLLRAEANPYWHGRKPVVVAQTRPDLFEMQGVPETDLVRDLQDALHTLMNMIFDSLKLTVLRGVTYREGSVVDPNMLDLRPLFRWAVSDHDDVRPFEVPQLGGDVFQMLGKFLGDMERVTGISAYATGADSSTIDQTTATGVTALQSAANVGLRFKAKQIQQKGFQRTYEQWAEMIPQFLSRPTWVKITGQDRIASLNRMDGVAIEPGDSPDEGWWEISPQDIIGDFHIRLEGTEEALSQQLERNEAIGLLNAVAPYVQMGRVNPDPLIERVAMANGVADPKSLIAQPAQAPAAQPNGNGQPQSPEDLQRLLSGVAMPQNVQQAIGGPR